MCEAKKSCMISNKLVFKREEFTLTAHIAAIPPQGILRVIIIVWLIRNGWIFSTITTTAIPRCHHVWTANWGSISTCEVTSYLLREYPGSNRLLLGWEVFVGVGDHVIWCWRANIYQWAVQLMALLCFLSNSLICWCTRWIIHISLLFFGMMRFSFYNLLLFF